MMNRREALQLLGSYLVLREHPLPLSLTMQPAQITRPIPSSGEKLPVIGLGTYQTFDVGANAAERSTLTQVLREFAELGGKIVDSSPMYGRSEGVVGDIMVNQHLRERLFVATKVWISGKQAGITQMKKSMSELRVDKIDLMQVHNLLDVEAHLATLAEWKQSGLVRHVGVTHYTASSLNDAERAVLRHKIDFVQINYSIGERDVEKRLLPLCAERGVAVIANRPFAAGNLFQTLRAKPLPSWAAEIGCKSWAQVMLKFVVSHPAITCAIPATSKVEHLRDNMGAGVGVLPDAALRAKIAAVVG